MMAARVFPLAVFRELYPQFSGVSDEAILALSVQAECLVSSHGCGCEDSMWMLMVAHMLAMRDNASNGGSPAGTLASASIDKVSVSFQAPPTGTSYFKFWLSGTPYGAELLAMLSRCSVGGLYVGGAPERAAFRIVGGRFPNRGRVW